MVVMAGVSYGLVTANLGSNILGAAFEILLIGE